MTLPCRLFAILFLVASAIAQAPKQGTLATDTQIPLVVEGKTVGSMTLKAGAEVTIVQILPNNEGVLITRGEAAPAKIPVEALTPASLQAAQAAQTAALEAQNADLEAQAAKQKAGLEAKKAAETALAKLYPGASAENKALYLKIESLIKNGKKKKIIRPDEQDWPLTTYEYNPWGTNNPIGQILHKGEITKHFEPADPNNKRTEFKIVAMLGIVVAVEGGDIFTPDKDILPEAFQKIVPNVKRLTTLDGKKVYLDTGGLPVGVVGTGFHNNGGRILGIQTDASPIYIDLCTPESVAAALSN